MKKNKLTTAVIAGLAGVAGVASIGNAVHVNPEGTGQVLIYPYYSVVDGLNTTYSVVNTTNQVKAVKVRFLEGQNSREVLDFNVYLSPFDVWVAGLAPGLSSLGTHGGESTAQHYFSDTSCTPALSSPQQFLPYEIDNDAPQNNMQRTTDGHFEVLEMGVVDAAYPLAGAATHIGGVPANCAAIEAAFAIGGIWQTSPNDGISPPTGGLFGGASIFDVAEGFNVSYDAIALDSWSDVTQHTNPGSLSPSIADVSPSTSNVFVNGATLTDTLWTEKVQAVSATLMRSDVYNEYNFEAGVEGKSAWIVTMPTKFQHVNKIPPAIPPFSNVWGVDAATGNLASCDDFELSVWDREERTKGPGDILISPLPPGGENPRICYEANTVEFIAPGAANGSSNVLGGNNLISVQGVPGGNQAGWAKMSFTAPANVMSGTVNDYYGLPVVGFMVQRFTNNNASPGVLAQYGGLFNHKGLVNSAN